MLHGVEIKSVISVIILGAILLAVFYQAIMFYYSKDRLLLTYLIFLVSAGFYVFFYSGLLKIIFSPQIHYFFARNFAEGSQILYLVAYTNFIVKSFDINKKNSPKLYTVWMLSIIIFSAYAVFITVYTFVLKIDYHSLFLFKFIRILGVLLVILMLWYSYRLPKLTFQKIILKGGLVYFIFLILSIVSQVFFREDMLIYPPEWLIIGVLIDILFFSSALNYRNRKKLLNLNSNLLEAAKEKIKIQKELIQNQKNLQNERSRIAADMHDDLGSGLTKISYLSQMAMTEENSSENLKKIKETSLSLVENMSELIWAMREENNRLDDLVAYMRSYAYEYLELNKIQLQFSAPENFENVVVNGEVRRNIFLVMKELLHNIVKHAKAENVVISIETDGNLKLSVVDDGIGFQTAQTSHILGGNGLGNVEKRVDKIGGKLGVTSTTGKTAFEIMVPLV